MKTTEQNLGQKENQFIVTSVILCKTSSQVCWVQFPVKPAAVKCLYFTRSDLTSTTQYLGKKKNTNYWASRSIPDFWLPEITNCNGLTCVLSNRKVSIYDGRLPIRGPTLVSIAQPSIYPWCCYYLAELPLWCWNWYKWSSGRRD